MSTYCIWKRRSRREYPHIEPPRQPEETVEYEEDPFALGVVDDKDMVAVSDFLLPPEELMDKVSWTGVVVSVQPRIRLTRSFDERWHTYLGYMLIIDGEVDGEKRRFSVGIGKVAQMKNQFRVGQSLSGNAAPVADTRLEPVDFYRASKLKVLDSGSTEDNPPPWHTPASELDVYRERGHRRLSARTYDTACLSCTWGCRMAVEMIIDQWNPGQKRYRTETFCYGPKSCRLYKAGPTRKVPGRKGMSWEEEDWVDEDATAHREPDE